MLSPGLMLGRFRLDECLDAGGKADVWRCFDLTFGRTAALKLFLVPVPEELGFARRFVAGARAVGRINHHGVVAVLDCVVDESGWAYWVMQYLEGERLSRRLARVDGVTPASTMTMVAQAADALHAAHELGVIHGRLKPAHVLIGSDDTIVLTGFDVDRPLWDNVSPAGIVMGGDMSRSSPEQALGEPATPRSDVFTLGLLAYRCLSRRRPFDGDNQLEWAMRRFQGPVPPLPTDIASDVRTVVERALAKDPAARWPSAAAMAQAAREAGN
jgi:eukaryotic-like serine/threonine-protein kinase